MMFRAANTVRKETPVAEDILSAFDKLDVQRKLVLCDQLFHSGATTYRNTVRLLWPASSENDAARLERYLRSRMKR